MVFCLSVCVCGGDDDVGLWGRFLAIELLNRVKQSYYSHL